LSRNGGSLAGINRRVTARTPRTVTGLDATVDRTRRATYDRPIVRWPVRKAAQSFIRRSRHPPGRGPTSIDPMTSLAVVSMIIRSLPPPGLSERWVSHQSTPLSAQTSPRNHPFGPADTGRRSGASRPDVRIAGCLMVNWPVWFWALQ
jgi:hypothetical protein